MAKWWVASYAHSMIVVRLKPGAADNILWTSAQDWRQLIAPHRDVDLKTFRNTFGAGQLYFNI